MFAFQFRCENVKGSSFRRCDAPSRYGIGDGIAVIGLRIQRIFRFGVEKA